jgi:hypothetical protein
MLVRFAGFPDLWFNEHMRIGRKIFRIRTDPNGIQYDAFGLFDFKKMRWNVANAIGSELDSWWWTWNKTLSIDQKSV